MSNESLKPSYDRPEKKTSSIKKNRNITIMTPKDGMKIATVEVINIARKENESLNMTKTTFDEDKKNRVEEMWFCNNKETYENLLKLFNQLNTKPNMSDEVILLLQNLKTVLGELIYTTDKKKFGPTRKVCRILANLIYKTTKPNKLNSSQLSAITKCLSFIIEQNCSKENYLKVDSILLKANLDWLTGDKEYR